MDPQIKLKAKVFLLFVFGSECISYGVGETLLSQYSL